MKNEIEVDEKIKNNAMILAVINSEIVEQLEEVCRNIEKFVDQNKDVALKTRLGVFVGVSVANERVIRGMHGTYNGLKDVLDDFAKGLDKHTENSESMEARTVTD